VSIRVTPTRWSAASCNLPNGTGRTVRVAVFARGAKAEEAKKAGADIVGAEDLVEIVQKGEDQLRPLHRDPGHDGRSSAASVRCWARAA
jgi:hypothetical protein